MRLILIVIFTLIGLQRVSLASELLSPSDLEKTIHDRNDKFNEIIIYANANKYIPTMNQDKFDRRCQNPLDNGIIEDFVLLRLKLNFDKAAKKLSTIYSQIKCISSARFRTEYLAFKQSYLSEEDDEDIRLINAILPIAFLMYESATPILKAEFQSWLVFAINRVSGVNAVYLKNEPINAGVFIPTDYGIVPFGNNWKQKLSLYVESLIWISGNCTAKDVEVIPVSVPGGTHSHLFCAKDCLDSTLTGDNPNIFSNNFYGPVPEILNACNQERRHFDALRNGLGAAAIRNCFSAFRSQNANVLACTVDAARNNLNPHSSKGSAFFPNWSPSARQREIEINRRCNLSERRSEYGDNPHWSEVSYETKSGGFYYRREGTVISGDGRFLIGVQVEQSSENGVTVVEYESIDNTFGTGPTYTGKVTITDEEGNVTVIVTEATKGDDGVYRGTRTTIDNDGKQTVENVEGKKPSDIAPSNPNFTHGEAPEPADGDQNDMCSPAADTCSDSCSIFDQAAEEFSQCFERNFDEGTNVGPSDGPDPLVSMPDPAAVDALDPALSRFSNCLKAARRMQNWGQIADLGCPVTRCPNGEEPQGPRCLCASGQLIPNAGIGSPKLCALVQCDPTVDICPCDELSMGGGPLPVDGDPTSPEPTFRFDVLGRLK